MADINSTNSMEKSATKYALLNDLPHDFSTKYLKNVELSLKSRQQGYKYFCESYFESVKLYKDPIKILVSAKCHRSQRKNEIPHSINIDISPDAIDLAHCSCVAGASGSCSHIVGLIIGLEQWILIGLTSVPDMLSSTSLPQQWSIPRGSKIDPEAVPHMVIMKPRPNRKQAPIENTVMNCRNITVKQSDIDHLKSLSSLPIHYLVCTPYTKKRTLFGEVGIGTGLSTHAAFYEPKKRLNVGADCGDLAFPYDPCVSLPDMYAPLPTILTLNKEKATEIEECTREQNACERWHLERKKRLTASKFYELLKRKKITEKYIASILKPSTFTSAPTSYGIANESKAKKLYVERQGNHVHDSGLCINPAFPFLGATPDGKVCDKGVCGILEVKCPYQARDMTIQQAIESVPKFCLRMVGNDIKLDETHAYYYQIQGQLMITGASFCDFVVFTRKDLFVQRVQPNIVFITDILNSLCRIYFAYFHDKVDFDHA